MFLWVLKKYVPPEIFIVTEVNGLAINNAEYVHLLYTVID